MAKLVWDNTGERTFELGDKKVVLYVMGTTGKYDSGVVWNGVTAITESPSGAEANDLYADDIKYASLRSAETFGGTIEAYTYPDEFAVCDGSAEIGKGVYIGQQQRKKFALSYVTSIGSDTETDYDKNYKIHLIYNATASPSEKSYQTINDSPDAISLSWEFDTTPVNVDGYKPTATITIDSTKADATKLKQLEDKLYGTAETEPTIPSPDEVIAMFTTD